MEPLQIIIANRTLKRLHVVTKGLPLPLLLNLGCTACTAFVRSGVLGLYIAMRYGRRLHNNLYCVVCILRPVIAGNRLRDQFKVSLFHLSSARLEVINAQKTGAVDDHSLRKKRTLAFAHTHRRRRPRTDRSFESWLPIHAPLRSACLTTVSTHLAPAVLVSPSLREPLASKHMGSSPTAKIRRVNVRTGCCGGSSEVEWEAGRERRRQRGRATDFRI